MRGATMAVLLALVAAAQAVTFSQSGTRQPGTREAGTYVTKADIDATLQRAPENGVMDQQIRVVDVGKANVAIGVLHRSAKAKQTAISHTQVTEVYHIISGSGTFVTGGTMVEPKPAAPEGEVVKVLVGPSINGASIQNGESRKVGPGDVIVLPPGVAHWFSAMDADMNYLVVRVDPDKVLPTGYVNPAVAR